jgi:hypothetical protein
MKDLCGNCILVFTTDCHACRQFLINSFFSTLMLLRLDFTDSVKVALRRQVAFDLYCLLVRERLGSTDLLT